MISILLLILKIKFLFSVWFLACKIKMEYKIWIYLDLHSFTTT